MAMLCCLLCSPSRDLQLAILAMGRSIPGLVLGLHGWREQCPRSRSRGAVNVWLSWSVNCGPATRFARQLLVYRFPVDPLDLEARPYIVGDVPQSPSISFFTHFRCHLKPAPLLPPAPILFSAPLALPTPPSDNLAPPFPPHPTITTCRLPLSLLARAACDRRSPRCVPGHGV